MRTRISLEQTSSAIANYAATRCSVYGFHDYDVLKAGGSGDIVTEVDFDPVRHEPFMINPLSLWEDVVEIPQVAVTRPDRPLYIGVIKHYPAAEGLDDEFGYSNARRVLAASIGEALVNSLPGITDRVWSYAVGQAADEVNDSDTEVINTNGDPEADAEVINGLSKGGINFIVSDFLKLPLDKFSGRTATVGIKVNVPADIAINAAGVVIRSGRKVGEVDAGSIKDAETANRYLKQHHERIIDSLQTIGISTASIIADPSRRAGFDLRAADLAIATAINQA